MSQFANAFRVARREIGLKVSHPGLFLGATPQGGDFRSCCALHSNRMVLDENVMARGVAMHCAYAEAFLSGGFGD